VEWRPETSAKGCGVSPTSTSPDSGEWHAGWRSVMVPRVVGRAARARTAAGGTARSEQAARPARP
jgi:hypothetical protein